MSHPNYGGGGGSGSKSGLGNIGSFVKSHGTEVATTALMYKMGGKVGKVMAAGQAYGLAKKYNKEHGGGSSSHSGAGPSNYDPYAGQTSRPHSQGKGLGGDLLSSGKDLLGGLLGKKEKQQNEGAPQEGYHPAHAPYQQPAAYNPYASGQPMPQSAYPPQDYGMASTYPPQAQNMDLLHSGATVSLVSKATGRIVQIVQAADGRLVLDANGMEGPHAVNTHFIVVRESEFVVLLHNNSNYVAMMNGLVFVQRSAATGQCRFQPICSPYQTAEFSFESTAEPGFALAFYPNGQAKVGGRPSEQDSTFMVRPVGSAMPPPPPYY